MQATLTKSITSIKPSETGIVAEFRFPLDAPIFAGHFPGMPVIPAVYQVGLCRKIIERDGNYKFAGIIKSRFSKMCVPGKQYTLKISLTKKEEYTEAVCSIYENAGKELCSKIVILFNNKKLGVPPA
jgi:3-hydroxymyristoyl/3-hydroxydecanoyl-(acyl carrier protein) dehydratase